MPRLLTALIVVGLFGPAAPGADDKDPPKPDVPPRVAELLRLTPEEFLKRFDKDKNGLLSKDELPPRLSENFRRYDSNGDGQLDRKEVAAMLEELRRTLADRPPQKPGDKPADAAAVERRVSEIFERMDTNKDGKISKEEARGPLAENFERLDANKDGFLDKDEVRRMVARNMAAGGGPGGAAAPGPDFDALDRNADGRLSREELKGTPWAEKFAEIDTNGDGTIDKKEFAAYLKKQAEKKSP